MGLLSSIASSVGDIFSKMTGAQALQNNSQQFNSAEAAKNREWLEMMSNSAHQREIKDLKAAGLNPILSTGGSGATTPSGSQAQAGIGSGTGDPIAAISSAANVVKQWNLMDSEKAKNMAEANKAKANAEYTSGAQTKSTEYGINKMKSEIELNSAKSELIDSQKNLIGSEIELNSAKSLLTAQQRKTEVENTVKTHNEAWESIHRSQKLDSEKDYNKRRASGKAANLTISKGKKGIHVGGGATW